VRVLVFLLNLCIVLYLAWVIRENHDETESSEPKQAS